MSNDERKRERLIRWLLTSNLLLVVLLAGIALAENYPQHIWKKLTSPTADAEEAYRSNPFYAIRTDLFAGYKKRGNVVMLGNSLTQRVDWNELLDRCDVINRGIGGDTTEGFLLRLESVIAPRPRLCLILGGINDLVQGTDEAKIAANLKKIALTLKRRKIEPVLQSLIYVSATYPDAAALNRQVAAVNDLLGTIARDEGLLYIDLNQALAPEEALNLEYTTDGVHLNSKGYAQWAAQVEPVIETELKTPETSF